MNTGKKILVVEDDCDSLYLMEILIAECGHRFTGVLRGEDCLQVMRTDKFDLVLMDLRLPGISGYETVETIRREISKDVPIFAITAHTAQANSLRCYDIGMNEFIPKPIDIEKFKELVRKYVGCMHKANL